MSATPDGPESPRRPDPGRIPDPLDRALTWSGAAAVVVSFVAIVASTLLAPWFSWTGNALSELGAPGEPYAWLFNWGLILGGLLGSVFVCRVALESDSVVGWAGSALLLAATGSLAAVGAFPVGDPRHGPAAVAFFVFLTYGLVADGSARVLAGRPRTGLLVVWLGMANATAWLLWALVAAAGDAPGVAIPEFVGALAMAGWVYPATQRVRRSAAED